jgi:hypothetical protein
MKGEFDASLWIPPGKREINPEKGRDSPEKGRLMPNKPLKTMVNFNRNKKKQEKKPGSLWITRAALALPTRWGSRAEL